MADFDKDGLMNILNSIISDGNKNEGDSFEEKQSEPQSYNSDLLDTAQIMSKVTDVMDRLNRSKNNREFVLLSALRPYMRTDRRGKIDSLLKGLQIIEVLKNSR